MSSDRGPRGDEEILRRQKAAAERIRREVMGEDGSLRHPYFRAVRRQTRRCISAVSLRRVVAACAEARLVYVGDFHAVPRFQLFAAELLEELVSRNRHWALGVEFVYTRQQHLLDRRQVGLLDDETFLKRIHYREEWGYPWDGFRVLLDRARDLEIPVRALDSPPRGGFSGLARRDAHAARIVAETVTADPQARLLALFGESHLARSHIPRRVRARLKRTNVQAQAVTVFQDPDALYWDCVARHRPVPNAVRVDEETYAVFHTTPLAKYEAYRQVLERWKGDVPAGDEVDLTPAVHHLIRVLLDWLGIRPERRRLHHPGGWSQVLSDAFPEVYSGRDAGDLLPPILEEHGRSPEEVDEAERLLRDRGALYDSRPNAIFLLRYLPGRAAAAGARFLRTALVGRLFQPPEDPTWDPALRTYGAAYTEALTVLGATPVDPASAYLESGGPSSPGIPRALPDADRWIEAHRRFERSRRLTPPADLARALRESRPLRRMVARDLGRRIGEDLFREVRAGSLDRKALKRLFTRPLSERTAAPVVLRLLRARGEPG